MGIADVAALRREQTELRKRLDAIDLAIKADNEPAPEEYDRPRAATVTVSVPSNGFVRPTVQELQTLADRVYDEHEWLDPCCGDSFARAFVAIGCMYRLAEPSRKLAFSSHVENVGDVLGRMGMRGVPGNAVLAAIIGHGDIAWRAQDLRVGQLLEVALDPYVGRKCNNRWRAVLQGEPLLPSLPPRTLPGGPSVPLPRFSVYRTV
jgi:hypothetical protein